MSLKVDIWCDQLYSSALFFSNIYDFGSEFKIIVMLKMKLLPIDCFNDVKFQAVERPVNQTMKLLPIRSFPDCIAQSKSDATFLCLHFDKTSKTQSFQNLFKISLGITLLVQKYYFM